MLTKQVPRSGLVAPGRYSAFFRSSVDLSRSQSSYPVKNHACNSPTYQNEQPEYKSRGPQKNQTKQREDKIWIQESFSVGHQLKPKQCDERSGSQRQSEPLVFEGANHIASAVAPINRAFSQKPTSADPLSPNRCQHQDASHSGAHGERRGSMSAAH